MKSGLIILIGLVVLAGCSTTGEPKAETGGARSGSLLGGIVGRDNGPSIASTIIAEMDGGLVKGSIGAQLDSDERTRALEAEYRALEYTPGGQKVTWQGKSGRYGEVVAAQAYRVGSQDCRQYAHTVFSGGPVGTARGTACRNADGSWTPLT